jgi:hypothetical protein
VKAVMVDWAESWTNEPERKNMETKNDRMTVMVFIA